MPLRLLSFLLLAAVLGSAGWHYRDSFASFGAPPPKPKPFVFDNGSVREPPASAADSGPKVASTLPQGTLRKCAKGGEVIYTNVACPPRYKELSVGGNVNVVASQDAAQPAAPRGSDGGKRLPTVRDVLDTAPDERMRERVMQRAETGR